MEETHCTPQPTNKFLFVSYGFYEHGIHSYIIASHLTHVRFKVILAMDKWSHIYISNIEILSILQITGKCNVFRGGSRGGRIQRGADPEGGAPPPPLKLVKIWFVGVISWFFTRNTPEIFAPPFARRNFLSAPPPPNLKSWIRPWYLSFQSMSIPYQYSCSAIYGVRQI